MSRQAVLNVLNSLDVIESQGGEEGYILVENNDFNRNELNTAGVTTETIDKYGDDETFCILALAFGEGYADEYNVKKGLVIWEPLIDDELRCRVLEGEGTVCDAERLLRALEPKWFGNKLEILNSIEAKEYEADGANLIYFQVSNTPENKQKLLSIGVPVAEIEELVGKDQETIDISSFGFRYGGAKWYHPDLGGWIDYVPNE